MTTSPITLSVTETEKLLIFLADNSGFCRRYEKRLRNYTMALIMLDTGLRVGELTHLYVSDLWLDNQPKLALAVRPTLTKTKTARLIPLSKRIRGACVQMWNEVWQLSLDLGNPYAFHSFRPSRCIAERQVQRIIKQAATRAIDRGVTPHALRHTFATRLMRTTNIRVVQTLLGHASLSSTQIYTHPTSDDLRTAIDSM